MADFQLKFTSVGGDAIEREFRNILSGATATSRELLNLSRTLGTSSKNAAIFASNIGLSVNKSNEVASSFRQLRASGLSVSEAFKIIQRETGITATQYKNLVLQLKSADTQLDVYTNSLRANAAAQAKTADASAAQLLALQQVNQAATQVASALQQFTRQAVSEFIEFDDALTSVSAKTGIAKDNMTVLKEAILETALVTSQSPTSAAKAADSLIALGATADEAAAKVKTVAQLADALRTVGATAEKSGKVIQLGTSLFEKFGETAQTVGDKIAVVSDTSAVASSTGLDEFLQLFSKAGGLAAQLGVDLNELLASFATLRDAGQAPEVAATSLKSLLSTILESRKELEKLNIKVFDSQGKFVGLTAIFKQIEDQNLSLTTQVELFGKIGIASATALSENYEKTIIATKRLSESQGDLQRKSDTINSSFKGQIELLTGSFQAALIDIGKSVGQFTGPAVQGITKLVNAFLAAPPAFKDFVGVSVGVTTAAFSVTAAVTGLALAIKALQVAQVGQTLTTIGSTVANVANTASFVAQQAAILGFGKTMATVGALVAVALGKIQLLLGGVLKGVIKVLPLAAALAGVVVAAKLVQASYEGVVGPANRAGKAVDNLNATLDKYNQTSGNVVQKTEITKTRFGELKDVLDDIGLGAKSLFVLEAAANRLEIVTGDLQPTLNSLSNEFNKLKQAGKLDTLGQDLLPALEAAKVAIAALQAEGVKNNKVSGEQLAVWSSMQLELTGLIDQINGAKTSTKELSDEQTDSYDKLQRQLAQTEGAIETDLLNAQAAAYDKLGGNKEALDARLAEIEKASLNRRLETQLQYLKDLQTATFEEAGQRGEAIAAAEQEVAQIRLDIAQNAAEQLQGIEGDTESTKTTAEKKLEIEKAAADEKEAIAQRTNQRLKILLDEQTNDLETALDSRIAKENAAIESINDQTDALSQQLELIKLIGEQEDIIAQRRLDAINQSIDANQKQLELAQILNDEGASEEQKTLAAVEARARGLNLFVSEDQLISQINAKREEARRVEAAQLATQQQRAQEELAYQQELQRLDLDRQVRQAEINAIEAERTVIQAEQLLKSQMIELSEQNRLLIQAQLNGASAAELQNIAAQIDLIQSQIDLSTESVNLARESVKLSQAEVTDATELRKNYEQIAAKQTENLKLQQESDRQQQQAGDAQERIDDKVQQELAKVKVKQQSPPPERFRRSGTSPLEQWRSITGRAEGGPVSANTPYVVGEKGPELFLPNTNGNILPNNLFQTLGNLPLDRPGTFVPKVLGGLNLDSLAAEIKGLRRDLQNRPVPVVNAPTTFVNEPNPLAAQMAMLQNQLKAARAI